MTPSRYLVLANAGAGSAAENAVGAALARLAEHAPVELRWTADHDEFRDAVRSIDADDVQLVVAGGDGTIHLALGTVADLGRNDRPVGIIPLGTGNDFARNHSIPLDPGEAGDAIVAGGQRSMPAIELISGSEKDLVANNLHIGIGVDAARRAKALKPYTGRFSYPLATVYEGVTGSPRHLEVHGDGDLVWSGPALAVLALLGPSMGGGVEVVPERTAAIDLVVIGPADTKDRLGLARAVSSGSIEEHPAVHRRTVTTASVAGDGAASLDADVDGELVDLVPPVELRHVADAWKVIVPPAR